MHTLFKRGLAALALSTLVSLPAMADQNGAPIAEKPNLPLPTTQSVMKAEKD